VKCDENNNNDDNINVEDNEHDLINEANSSTHVNNDNNNNDTSENEQQQQEQTINNNNTTHNSNKQQQNQTQPSSQYNNNTITSSFSKSIPFHPQLYPLPTHIYLNSTMQTLKRKEMYHSTSNKQTMQREPTQKEMLLYLRKNNKQYSSCYTTQKQFDVMNTLSSVNNDNSKRYVCKGNGKKYKMTITQRSIKGGNEDVPLMYKYFKRRLEREERKRMETKEEGEGEDDNNNASDKEEEMQEEKEEVVDNKDNE
jgi:ribosomal protein L34E